MIDDKLAPYGVALLRASLGLLALAHGLLKLLVFTPAGTVGFFESLGLPAVLAYATMVIEIGGGLALLAGIYTRYVALAMIPILVGSIVFGHWQAGWLFSNQGGGWEFPAFWAVALALQVLLGDGAYAMNRAAGRLRPATAS